jgi:tRNA G18 (ribose-2'-O)-methylase SpoU
VVTAIDLQVLVLGCEKEGILVNLIQVLDACMEIPQLGVIRPLNVHCYYKMWV